MTHNEMVLDHMKRFGGITSMEAFTLYGCTRLSARIKDLRGDGHRIDSVHTNGMNRDGKKVWFTRYVLRDA